MGDQDINLKEIDEEERGILKGWEDINLGCGGIKNPFPDISISISEKIKKTIDIITHLTEEKISTVCKQLEIILKEKNKRYGDSALHPIGVFSKTDAENGLYKRADDKLSRIKNSNELRKNDIADLMGYCVLICIEKKWFDWSDLID